MKTEEAAPARCGVIDAMLLPAITGLALAGAGAMFAEAWSEPDALWRGPHHDRNFHLATGLAFAAAIRAGDLQGFLAQLLASTIWPPVHGLVLGAVLLPTMDFRLGIVPSLFGWTASVVLAAMVARRFFADPALGVAAALSAAVFTAASPAFRLLGSDVMLEALGAGLSVLSLHLYLSAMAAPQDTRRWRRLAVAATLLFFEKYNYWAMLSLALALAFVVEQPAASLARWRRATADLDWTAAARRAGRDPLVALAAVAAVVATAIAVIKPAPVTVDRLTIRLFPPGNVVTFGYAMLAIVVVRGWRRHRAAVAARLGPGLTAMLAWHLAPVLLSFALPQRLSGFVWFLGPANSHGTAHSDPIAALAFQAPGFAEGFHVAPWSAALALGLAACAAPRLRRLAPGGMAIPLFVLVGAAAVLIHPQQQWRFQATWLVGLWIAAGVGGAMLLDTVTRRLPAGRRAACIAAAVLALAGAEAMAPRRSMAFDAAIRAVDGPSDRDLARAFLPLIPGRDPVGIITTFGRTDFPIWAVRSDCRCERAVEAPFNGATREAMRRSAAAWLARTDSRHIVAIDAPDLYRLSTDLITRTIFGGGLDALADQHRFARRVTVPVPSFSATVTLWERAPDP